MRSLDKDYFTPVFRKHDLVRLNADGCFMTRSLAENYPYTQLYKAAMRGAQDEWLEIIDLVESGSADPLLTLKHLIRMLLQKKSDRKILQDKAVSDVKRYSKSHTSLRQTIDFILEFAKYSSNASRVFEVGMHSLFQVFEDFKALDGYLAPLSQMRSANKKHGNIGDIEITNRKKGSQISEAWDAKYGKPYLRKELDELDEKLREHPETKIAGFVVDSNPNLSKEIKERIEDLEKMLSVEIVIVDFSAWAINQVSKYGLDERKVASEWLVAFAETLCELRRNRAPIDEPSAQWAENLISFIKARENQLF